MNCTDVRNCLDEYIDGELDLEQHKLVESHLRNCMDCQHELAALRSLLARAATLPKSVPPARDLWTDIALRLGPRKIIQIATERDFQQREDGLRPSALDRATPRFVWTKRMFAAAAVLIVGFGSFWLVQQGSKPSWRVTRLEGAPQVGSTPIGQQGQLRLGELLETDASSRAKINVGVIGNVEVEPNSRLRLLQAVTTDHRLALYRGTIHAKIWAPPRLFFVETPSATAIDLGCEYTLAVDEQGASVLHVTTGWVALEFGGRESIVPAGALCVTRSGRGPGTPFLVDASNRLRSALQKLDFEEGGSENLTVVLSEARTEDAVTLWHLLLRAVGDDRSRVYDRLTALLPPPEDVTREGVLRGDPEMLKAWQYYLGLGINWWEFWK